MEKQLNRIICNDFNLISELIRRKSGKCLSCDVDGARAGEAKRNSVTGELQKM